MQTIGISPKAILAAILPALGGVLAVGIQWIATGEFNRPELATALSSVVASLLAFFGAWLGKPGAVTEIASSDALMDAEAAGRLRSEGGVSDVGVLMFIAGFCLAVVLIVLL